MLRVWALLAFGVLLVAAAIGVNVWATLRVLRFPFTNGQRVAQIALIWLFPGFCLFSLLATRSRVDHPSAYEGPRYPFDFYGDDITLPHHDSGHDVHHDS